MLGPVPAGSQSGGDHVSPMPIVPIALRRGPNSIEKFTQQELPAGLFETALKEQWIACTVENVGDEDLLQVTFAVTGLSGTGILVRRPVICLGRVAAQGSVDLRWLADFESARPGQRAVRIIAHARGMRPMATVRTLYVSATRRDSKTGDFACVITRDEAPGPRAASLDQCMGAHWKTGML